MSGIRHSYGTKQKLAVVLIIIGVLLLFFREKKYPDVILITIDSLRADHLSCYGYKRLTSPNIDKLASEGVVFRNCFTASDVTTGSFPAMLTGLYLINYFSVDEVQSDILGRKFTTLAEHLKRLGYQTAAFSGNPCLNRGSGFEQGFDIYESPYGNTLKITEKVLNYLHLYLPSNRNPLFLWVHYLDPHYPYSPPKEYERLFKNDLLYQENDKIWATFIPATEDEPLLIGAFSGYRYPLNELISCYDAEINFVDYNVGRILRSLPRDAVIIITADHGESLGEDNECGHGSFTETTLHIPLIIKDNKHFKGGKSILSAVSSIDIVPTILNTVSRVYYFFLRGKFQGIDLSELLKQDRGRRKYIYSYNPPLAIIREVNKNIVVPNYNHKGYKRTDDRQDLFLLRQEMKKTLKRWLRNNSTPSSLSPNKGKLDKDTLDNLRNLGYTQ